MKIKIIGFILSIGMMVLTGCQSNNEKADVEDQIVRIHITDDPQSLDPRLERALEATTVLHAIYEGLMRTNMHGEPIPALAEKVLLSPDKKTYTFTLKKTFWSNGDPLTADHFVATWREILKPEFPAPNAYRFYMIKGAKAAKEGKIPFEEVGIQNPDPSTLIVELESPAPYFLELLTSHFFYPVHPQFSPQNVISNGPFKLKNWQKHHELILTKNSKYWDVDEVKLQKLIFMPLDEHTALRMYQNGELEWVGSPAGTLPQDAIATLKYRQQLKTAPAAGTHWFRINTAKMPLQSAKMRKAFAYAIGRKAIVENILQGHQKPATAIVPPSFKLDPTSYFLDNDTPKAWFLFQEALEEMRLSKDSIPSITLCYSNNSRNHRIAQAVQQQWNKTFNIEVKLESCESQIFYDRLNRQDYQIALGSWFADYQDPINFLEIFKYKNNQTNNTHWENSDYIQLLNQSSLEFIPSKRKDLFAKAESLLMQEMPVIPLFFAVFNYVKYDTLFGVYFSDLGYLDFKFAFYEDS
jgi:oligopeptide transport system substrate-binding protein